MPKEAKDKSLISIEYDLKGIDDRAKELGKIQKRMLYQFFRKHRGRRNISKNEVSAGGIEERNRVLGLGMSTFER